MTSQSLSSWVVAFDLSLTAPGACALPRDWKPGDWKRVKSWLLKPEPPKTDDLGGQLVRYQKIADWAAKIVGECSALGGRPACFVENYGFSKNNSQASRLMENGGAVKLEVFKRWKVVLVPIAQNTARKLFLGAVPQRDPKFVVQDVLFNKCGAPKAWDENQADAWVIANYGLSEVGGLPVAFPPPKKAKRKRAA